MTEQARPVLLVVDDDAETLETLQEHLEIRYAEHYRIVAALSATQAVDALVRFRLRETPVALVIVDCDLGDEDSGADVIERAQEWFPLSASILMAEYDDKENVLEAVRRLSLDSYLLKPLGAPEDDLYPLVSDLLENHVGMIPTTAGGAQGIMDDVKFPEEREAVGAIRVVGYRWSARSHQVKEFLARNLVPYQWLEIEQPAAQRLLERAGLDSRQLPVVFFPDGEWLAQPTMEELGEKVGLHNEAESLFYDLVVVGGGPAGLSAAVYGASEGLHTLLIEAEAPGGQAGMSSRIENYLGFPAGLSGSELTRRAVAQAERFGVEILTPQKAVGVRTRDRYRLVDLANGDVVISEVVLIATGVSYRRLEVPGEEQLTGAGVYYGAVITEAITCTDKEVFILGGGNSAGQAAMYLSRFASSITILTIADSLEETMSSYLIDQIETAGNIHVRTNSTVSALYGGDHLESITVINEDTQATETIAAAALFVYIGAAPRTGWLGSLLARDEQGYILTGPDVVTAGQNQSYKVLGRAPYFLESSVPGIFAAGDTRHGSVKRIASGVGEGAMAVTLMHQYLAEQ